MVQTTRISQLILFLYSYQRSRWLKAASLKIDLDSVRVNDITLATPDSEACNGDLHVIDGVYPLSSRSSHSCSKSRGKVGAHIVSLELLKLILTSSSYRTQGKVGVKSSKGKVCSAVVHFTDTPTCAILYGITAPIFRCLVGSKSSKSSKSVKGDSKFSKSSEWQRTSQG